MSDDSDEFARPVGAVETLRWAMREAGVTQASVAEAIGASAGAVSSWMAGRFRPSADSWLAALRACGFEVVVQPIEDGDGVEHMPAACAGTSGPDSQPES